MPACDGAATDPIVALIGGEKRWRLLAVAVRARAETLLFALPKDERPEEFDGHPIMAEALSLEIRADEVYDHIIETTSQHAGRHFRQARMGRGRSRGHRARYC
jgi:hypothetical protein